MKDYAPANIRNIAIVGHQDCGKTVLSEAMLFSSGAIGRSGTLRSAVSRALTRSTSCSRVISSFDIGDVPLA